MPGAVEPDEFLARPLGSRELGDPFKGYLDPQFFRQFPLCGGVVLLAGHNVAGGTGVPKGGMAILPPGPLLKKDIAIPVKNEDVNGPMSQVIPMHFAARRGAENAVGIVHHRKALFAVFRLLGGPYW